MRNWILPLIPILPGDRSPVVASRAIARPEGHEKTLKAEKGNSVTWHGASGHLAFGCRWAVHYPFDEENIRARFRRLRAGDPELVAAPSRRKPHLCFGFVVDWESSFPDGSASGGN
jgi:hypothetical protein